MRAVVIEKMAMAIYNDDPEEDCGWDDLGETIKDKIRHVADVALDAAFHAIFDDVLTGTV